LFSSSGFPWHGRAVSGVMRRHGSTVPLQLFGLMLVVGSGIECGDMRKTICMEMVLIFASILIFRSVWAFLDSWPWATSNAGQSILLAVGVVVAIIALHQIQLPTNAKNPDGDKG
jgi:uncharacterized membrane protein (GlpM family)